MIQVNISLAINLVIAIINLTTSGFPFGLNMAMFVFLGTGWAMSFIGSQLYYRSRSKSSYIVGIIGFAIYVPIGLIGLFGLRKMAREFNEKESGISLDKKSDGDDQ